ncbi:MAG: PAS domain S-box protein [bacterium]|nr:PAS domain S-box protein [bacterium]
MDKQEAHISSRLQSLNELSKILADSCRDEPDIGQVCSLVTGEPAYTSCWIALLNETGSITGFSETGLSEVLTELNPDACLIRIKKYLKNNFITLEDIIINNDPLFKTEEVEEEKTTLTGRLDYNDRVKGCISVTINKNGLSIDTESILFQNLCTTISHYLSSIQNSGEITNLKKRISQSMDVFNATLETTGNATILIEENTIISYANREFEKLSCYKKKEIENTKSLFEFVSENDLDIMKEYHRRRRISPTMAPRNYEFDFIDRYGKIKNIFITIDMVPGTRISIASFKDLTEKKKLESKIIKISEQERQLIGNDLHDKLSPHLLGIQFMLKLIREKVYNKTLPDVSDLDEIYDLISDGIDHIRKMLKGLKPVDIQGDGLFYALEEMAAKTKTMFGTPCKLHYEESILIDNNITATHLYYIIHEAVNNSVKHGKSKNIFITLKKENNSLVAEIRDDGIGIPKFPDREQGMGLDIMQYRAHIIGSTIDVFVNEPGGTTVRCVMDRV